MSNKILPCHIFCYNFSMTHHFLSYFLSSAPLKKERKNPSDFRNATPLRIPGHSPDAYNGVSGHVPLGIFENKWRNVMCFGACFDKILSSIFYKMFIFLYENNDTAS